MAETEKKITFEGALARLEKIVKELEEGKTSLDNSLKLFEEGTKLVKFCNKSIDSAEQKIKMLTEKNGEIVVENFSKPVKSDNGNT